MPIYSYTAKNLEGETKYGEMEADSEAAVARALSSEGFSALTIALKEAGGGGVKGLTKGKGFLDQLLKFDFAKLLSAVSGVPLADKIMFSRHLAVMISSGVPITRALDVLSKQTKNVRFKSAIFQVASDIQKGERISDSLKKHPRIFDSLYISMVQSGDAAGNLTEVLELLADHLKKEHDLRSRVRGALMYPAVIVFAMGGIGALMMTMVVPKIADIFKDLDTELPFLTKVIINLSDFISSYWYLVFGSIPVFLYIFKKALSTNRGKRWVSWFLLRAPILNTLTRKINSARFARTLSSLVDGGVPILEGIFITRDTLGNVYYKESLDKVYKDVKGGKSLYESIAKFENIYPGLITQMVRVGEETGALGGVLKRIAEFYEEEVDNATKNLSSVIEPILMLIIGAIVGIFAISMIQPMYSLMGNV
jgi:type IV pilus assembly protein PilC